ncbi:UDP-N-acetyl-D-mannosamine dehydrogenase [Anoxybacillus ayderensis]|uniref:UDP-N-acetyl-D-mannosamine dehydrogenase n=1 Tax=Anoxybacillus sp. ST70 TaxID=2864180 RepID=UPI00031D4825|nr:UDP-N-acetyl-D-mannosamine dehydrogenase [Anoxybacillus sp. ST70]AXM89054.1 UDP-N-acetyl-D-mannosamine dehydrogenase [Anoxybacillus ayderensis G10]KHF28226.1 UDP-N-acetyl-D-glucosamine 6-dehydrogenase [Anoxybacillus sp. BCO1]MBW9219063.1 UDP-N-acetyl-D-mannosamine dehydrogenase [Anoxybacillus sp. ST70]THD17268.1 UDP-N-acetyl-D-mannosamine dehydrogenase [Anoxybacillus ayderensis]
MQKVCVVGLGYIGLPTAALLANSQFQVHGVDINQKAIDMINNGQVHIYEPDLDKMVQNAVNNGNLQASTLPEKADVFVVAVPTPFTENYKPDLAYVEQATRSISPYLEPGNIVILESTSPVGTTEKVAKWILEERPDLNITGNSENRIFVAHCPERVLPGEILKELVENDRIIGGIDEESTKKTVQFYKKFVKGEILETNARTAELAKLTENAFRDVNIAFANELSMICDELNINVWELINLANHHPRVNILQPGPGVGGHCIAVDPWFIVDAAPETAKLIRTARMVNDSKPYFVIEKIKEVTKNLQNPTIVCLGLAFKANVDDLRESPAVKIVKELSAIYDQTIYVAEPHIEELPKDLLELNVQLVKTEEAIEKADVVVLLVDHDYFKEINPRVFEGKKLIDTRGIYKNEEERMTRLSIRI